MFGNALFFCYGDYGLSNKPIFPIQVTALKEPNLNAKITQNAFPLA
jgi:hypothetical protein